MHFNFQCSRGSKNFNLIPKVLIFYILDQYYLRISCLYPKLYFIWVLVPNIEGEDR